MGACSCRGNGTNATAGSRTACGGCGAGRRPNVSVNGGATRRTVGNMRMRNVSVAAGNVKNAASGQPRTHLVRPSAPPRSMILRRARGHAAKKSLTIFAVVLAVLSRCVLPAVLRLITVATSAARPCAACWIGNASSRIAGRRRLPDGVAAKMALREGTEGRLPAARWQAKI